MKALFIIRLADNPMTIHVDQRIYPPFSFTIKPPGGAALTVYRPDEATVEKTKATAKEIFVEAFATTYTGYHTNSKSADPIEKWLRLKEGLSLQQWLSNTFDGEYEEYKAGKKGFVYLVNSKGNLMGWLSHSPVSEKGELYLSQCSLEAASRGKKVASTAFAAVFQTQIHTMFPGLKEVKLIARRINESANWLYTKAGFTRDETINPAVYGDSYDNRYVGFRCTIPLVGVIKFDSHAGWQDIFQTFESIIPYTTSIVKNQYEAFKSRNAPAIADERIKSISINENNEELVDIKTISHERISMLLDPQKPFEGALFNSGLANASKLRKGVFLKLEKMVDELDKLAPFFGYKPGQISIKVFEGLRDLTTQAKLFRDKFDEIKNKNPKMTDEEVEKETAKWISPVRNNVPVHSTGAAVDIRLWDNDKNVFLDVGPFGVIWGANENAPTFSENGTLSTQQKLNRFLCVAAADLAGLTNYLFEHWHYSYGDRYHVYWRQNTSDSRNAIYGPVA